MKPARQVSRRSFIIRVTGGTLAMSSLGLVSGRSAAGQPSGITDRDPTDAIGNGRGNDMRAGTGRTPEHAPRQPFLDDNTRAAPTGFTDRDPSDPANYGRPRSPEGPPSSPYAEPRDRSAPSGVTDHDPTDPVGRGTGRRRCSDSDAGSGADPGGRGRRC